MNFRNFLEFSFHDKVKDFQGTVIKTGYSNLDQMLNLHAGLYVIGAGTSIGKTTFISQLADQIASAGHHVMFFTLEQNYLEMASKSLSRITRKQNPRTAVSAIDIRQGKGEAAVKKAIEEYLPIAERIEMIHPGIGFTLNKLKAAITETTTYLNNMIPNDTEDLYHIKPVIFIDYLQIIQDESNAMDKQRIDNIMTNLKRIQSEMDVVMFVVSSMNRSGYLNKASFEYFKESGAIEYTADVVWGLHLDILNDLAQPTKGQPDDDYRDKLNKAKADRIRKIELVCLKNRFGVASYNAWFNYEPAYDTFTPINEPTRRSAVFRTNKKR